MSTTHTSRHPQHALASQLVAIAGMWHRVCDGFERLEADVRLERLESGALRMVFLGDTPR